jgi:hypothetical protein
MYFHLLFIYFNNVKYNNANFLIDVIIKTTYIYFM